MEYSFGTSLLIICPLVFLAGFVDSIAGGGGLISIPTYLFAGLPIHFAYGTNKLSACAGTITASITYFKNGKINLTAALWASLAALPGSLLGTLLALYLSARVLQICLMIILPLAAIFILSRSRLSLPLIESPLSKHRLIVYSALIGLVIGAYDGFFGPGTGMFLTLAFTGLLNLDLVKAAGTARTVNLASNFASSLTYIAGGKVLFFFALPAALCAVAGNYTGSKLALKLGANLVRPIIASVALLLCVKILFDMF